MGHGGWGPWGRLRLVGVWVLTRFWFAQLPSWPDWKGALPHGASTSVGCWESAFPWTPWPPQLLRGYLLCTPLPCRPPIPCLPQAFALKRTLPFMFRKLVVATSVEELHAVPGPKVGQEAVGRGAMHLRGVARAWLHAAA